MRLRYRARTPTILSIDEWNGGTTAYLYLQKDIFFHDVDNVMLTDFDRIYY